MATQYQHKSVCNDSALLVPLLSAFGNEPSEAQKCEITCAWPHAGSGGINLMPSNYIMASEM